MNNRSAKWTSIIAAALLLIVAIVAALNWELVTSARVGLNWAAKIACSDIFLSGRSLEDVQKYELTVAGDQPLTIEVDPTGGSVTASVLGIYRKRAIYRDGLGCTLLNGTTETRLEDQAEGFMAWRANRPGPGPMTPVGGDDISAPPGVDETAVASAIAAGFAEPAEGPHWNTRAIVAFYRNHLIAERYAEGYDRETLQLGWSMTKSVNSALVGILVGEGKLDVDAPAPVPEWQGAGDRRGAITLKQLLQMRSGLEFEEVYEDDVNSDVNRMLFTEYDAAAYAAKKPLAAEPGTRWSYSSGTANILGRIVRSVVESDGQDYFSFPQRALFDRIGVKSAVMEPDPSGTFVGSSYMFATPLDWARLGLLYLNGGVWNGERILPEGWVEFTRTPVEVTDSGYGAQFWLNRNAKGQRRFFYLPEDMFYMSGHDGQFVVIIPSKRLVVVRMGFSNGPRDIALIRFVGDLVAALPE